MNKTVRHLCEKCETPIAAKLLELPNGEFKGNCPSCNDEFTLTFKKQNDQTDSLTNCPKCDGNEFYEQKDFNRNLGMAIIVAGALGMLIMIALGHEAYTAYIFLGAAVVVDWILYQFIANVIVCYKCDSVFKGIKFPEKTGEFSLETHDGYRYWDKGSKTT
jgi:hypothetical protein